MLESFIRQAAIATIIMALAGCTATESTLDPKAADPNAPVTLTPQAASPSPAEAITTQPVTAAPAGQQSLAGARVQFAPIVGAPVATVTPLSRRLSQRARENALKIVPANDPATTHLVKGYLSAVGDGGATTVIHVWDVMDINGNRLTRIQGEEKVPGEATDPWSVIPSATMESIADRLMRDLTGWIAANPS